MENKENHESCNLMEYIYSESGEVENEAWYFHCAKSGILSQPVLSENRRLSSIVTFYYYREAKAYLKVKNRDGLKNELVLKIMSTKEFILN